MAKYKTIQTMSLHKIICIVWLCLLSISAFADRVKISGTVTDEKGEPIMGASVVEMGTTNGITTNVDGLFSMEIDDKGKFQVSYGVSKGYCRSNSRGKS